MDLQTSPLFICNDKSSENRSRPCRIAPAAQASVATFGIYRYVQREHSTGVQAHQFEPQQQGDIPGSRVLECVFNQFSILERRKPVQDGEQIAIRARGPYEPPRGIRQDAIADGCSLRRCKKGVERPACLLRGVHKMLLSENRTGNQK